MEHGKKLTLSMWVKRATWINLCYIFKVKSGKKDYY